jgi:soluble lytic murein transglycosylase
MRRMLPERARIAGLLLLLLGWPATAPAQDLAAQRTAFASTLALTRAGVAQTAEIEALQGYPLYPYLQAARLQRMIADAPDALTDAQVAAFIDANRGELWARDVHKLWLASLADRAQWPTFLRYYEEGVADASLRCQQLTARLQTTEGNANPALRSAALARWMSADEQPSQCDAVFGWLKEQGALTDDAKEQRARLALKAGRHKLGRVLAQDLPADRAEPLLRWAALIQAPGPELEKVIARPTIPVDTDVLFDAFSRQARADGATALRLYEPLLEKRSLPKARRVDFTRVLATGLAMDRQVEAPEFYKDVPAKSLEERDHEWRLRSALWNGEWKLFLKWIETAPAAFQAQSRWRYWKARALDESGEPEEARRQYESLAEENGYHSVLAAQRLGRDFTPHNRPLDDIKPLQMQIAQRPSLQRAREAAAVGENAWVNPEWRAGMEGLSVPEKLQAARLAADWGIFEQVVTLTAQQQMFDDIELLYPQPYQREIAEGATLSGVPPELITSVMRQESLFRPDAVSSANAVGLLQMLPAVARETAKAWNLQVPTIEQLKQPQIIVPLGSAHLRESLDEFEGRVIYALAAYNAGPRALRRWLPERPADAEVWIENIPYNETRTYVQRILWNLVVYQWRTTDQPQNMKAHLAPVTKLAPRGS